jgi:squalene synthase HpnC
MAAKHYENFPVGSILLPAKLRRPIALIYAFARSADDFADEGTMPAEQRLGLLDTYSRELDAIEAGSKPHLPLFEALAPVIRDHALPIQSFRDLLSAFAQDVTKQRYADFGEVLDYCRRSANPVGRLLLHLFGASGPQPAAWSDNICSSLQLINFVQDVEIDYAKGRIYIPLDEMRRYGVREEQIARRDTGGGWRPLIGMQIDRARDMLEQGAPLGTWLRGRIGLELRLIVSGGRRIVRKLESSGGDVFRDRPVLKPFDWAQMLWRALAAY